MNLIVAVAIFFVEPICCSQYWLLNFSHYFINAISGCCSFHCQKVDLTVHWLPSYNKAFGQWNHSDNPLDLYHVPYR